MKMRKLIIGLTTVSAISFAAAQSMPPAPSGGGQRPPAGERPEGPPPGRPDQGGGERPPPPDGQGGRPPRPEGGGPGGPGGPGEGQGGSGERGPGGPGGPGERGPGGPGGPGQRPGGPGGPGGPRNSPVEAMKQYIELVDRYTTLAKDPSSAGVSAVVTLSELTRQKGPEETASRLNKLLGETKDATVQRAIRLQLIDVYKTSNQTDKAIEQAEILIRGQ